MTPAFAQNFPLHLSTHRWRLVMGAVFVVGLLVLFGRPAIAPTAGFTPQLLRNSVAFVALPESDTFVAFNPQATVTIQGSTVNLTFPAGLSSEMQFVGANADVVASGVQPQDGTVSLFMGADASAWQTGLSTFGAAQVTDLYSGIDARFDLTAPDSGALVLKSTFFVAAGADPTRLAWQYPGAALALAATGDLQIDLTGSGTATLIEQAPIAWQIAPSGATLPVAAHYVVDGSIVRVVLGEYLPHLPLVIDPNLVFGTYFGGTGIEEAFDVAVDSAGNVYVVGFTESNLPGNGFSARGGTRNVFVSKFSTTGQLLYTAYLGGGGVDIGFAIAVDGAGNAYVVGRTGSNNFPTQNPFSGSNGGATDAFIAKLSSDGNNLIYSTYIGGSGDDTALGITFDPTGNAYVTGQTTSPNFPLENPLQDTRTGSAEDAFVLKLSPNGNALIYSTYLGGDQADIGQAIVVDGGGAAYVVGNTNSGNFPTTSGAFRTSKANDFDAFVVKLSPGGNSLIYATFLGGGGADEANDVRIDGIGQAVVVGSTNSADFPVLGSVPQTSFGGGLRDGFIAKFSVNADRLEFATYYGGNGEDRILSMALDGEGTIYVTGFTHSENLPLEDPLQEEKVTTSPADIFVARLAANGSSWLYSTYLGGEDDEHGRGIAVDGNRNAYVAGWTRSINFPTSDAAFQPDNNGGVDAFVIKLDANTTLPSNIGTPGLVGTPATATPEDDDSPVEAATLGPPTDTPVPTATQIQIINPPGQPLLTETPTPEPSPTPDRLVLATFTPLPEPTVEGAGDAGAEGPDFNLMLIILCVGCGLIFLVIAAFGAYLLYEREQAKKRLAARRQRRHRKGGGGRLPPQPTDEDLPSQPPPRSGPTPPFTPGSDDLTLIDPPSQDDDEDDPLKRLRRL